MKSTCCICGLTFEARHSYGLCPTHCNKDTLREFDRVESLARYARRNNIYCSLTLIEWLSTLSDFYGLCAFCKEYTANVIERLVLPDGYTYFNVVPACKACSTMRRTSFERAVEQLAVYLDAPRPVKLFRDIQEDMHADAEYDH